MRPSTAPYELSYSQYESFYCAVHNLLLLRISNVTVYCINKTHICVNENINVFNFVVYCAVQPTTVQYSSLLHSTAMTIHTAQ